MCTIAHKSLCAQDTFLYLFAPHSQLSELIPTVTSNEKNIWFCAFNGVLLYSHTLTSTITQNMYIRSTRFHLFSGCWRDNQLKGLPLHREVQNAENCGKSDIVLENSSNTIMNLG
jgi:hypothetical protein